MLHPVPHDTAESGPLIEFRGVTCGYEGTPAVSDVDLTITSGDFVGLVGPSGAGKTTLLRAILGAVDIYARRAPRRTAVRSTASGPAPATSRSSRRSTGTSRSPSSRSC